MVGAVGTSLRRGAPLRKTRYGRRHPERRGLRSNAYGSWHSRMSLGPRGSLTLGCARLMGILRAPEELKLTALADRQSLPGRPPAF
jgi:hypothetical protein